MSIRSQKDLEIQLSKLKTFENPSIELEQYATPAHIAAEWVWNMAMKSEVSGRTILDAACGPGIIGLGLLLMGAKKVYFLDKDEKTMQTCIDNYNNLKEEYELSEAEFIIEDVTLFDEKTDIVVQNPPFGTKEEHADKRFLEKAFSVAPIVYSMHKYSTKKFVEAITKDFNFMITDLWRYDFAIKAQFKFHQKPVREIDVGLWRMEKSNN
jgi:putative methylase